eukprot:CAMPEP_0114584946 /NCGR_PEP_ID=MMETSP0125-20121206/8585_1 /TAXON_ID=485358 ORGANISM="Aristerostoma sp., Strain ATCC 50986" /NCGR_SAMPLE_ID=MMETSP0125 /ASSEMBLY_ACC=CAM_ASM_000245 /LENGTH=80 /DNA_ID=CAMNT_0001779723 /DNA_START=436 /DNA_END=678 /DNA_ORIENTATION=+
MIISIKNVNINYDNNSILNTQSSIKISLRDFNLSTIDEQGQPTFYSGSDKHHRIMMLSGFAITLNVSKEKKDTPQTPSAD